MRLASRRIVRRAPNNSPTTEAPSFRDGVGIIPDQWPSRVERRSDTFRAWVRPKATTNSRRCGATVRQRPARKGRGRRRRLDDHVLRSGGWKHLDHGLPAQPGTWRRLASPSASAGLSPALRGHSGTTGPGDELLLAGICRGRVPGSETFREESVGQCGALAIAEAADRLRVCDPTV
jgi:hypothetical protein